MKCPVCGNVNKSMVCLGCGFDSSRDFERYPTLGPVGKAPAVSALRREWTEKQRPSEPETPPAENKDRDFRSALNESSRTFGTEIAEKPRKKVPWIAIAACAATLAVGIWIGSGQGGGNSNLTTPEEYTQMQSSSWRGNLMKEVVYGSYYVYDTDILISTVQTVTFLDTLKDAPDDAVDVSANGDGSVMLWAVKRGDYYDLYYAANGGINARDAAQYMFHDYFRLEQIDFGGNFHTDEVQDMCGMFYNCHALTTLDLSTFNVSNVTHARAMFYRCTSLTELKMHSFDSSTIEDAAFMFEFCPAGDNWIPLS